MTSYGNPNLCVCDRERDEKSCEGLIESFYVEEAHSNRDMSWLDEWDSKLRGVCVG